MGAKMLDDLEVKKPLEATDEKCKDFDDVLKVVGSQGRYQKWLLYGFMFPLCIIEAFLAMHEIFILSEPDHWCAAKDGNPATEEWKNVSLPKTMRWSGKEEYSQCEMYNETGDSVPCMYGWEYDKTDYDATIPSEFNWVCSRSLYATHIFTIRGLGSLFGAIVFGRAADVYGRKPIFFITVIIKTLVTLISLFFPQDFLIFMGFNFIVGTAFPSMFLTSTMIVAEYCDAEFRAWTYAATWMIWVLGMAFMPFLAWLTRSWWLIGIICSLTGFPLLLYWPVLPESARLLISRGRTEEAVQRVMQVTKVNKTNVPEAKIRSMIEYLIENRNPEDQKARMWTLFSKANLAKNTIMICICWAMNGLIYTVMTLNTTKMAGNQFLNFFLMSLIELPSGFLGGKLIDITGRRWTQVGFFAAATLSMLAAVIFQTAGASEYVVTGFVLVGKFAITVTFLVVYLQATEIFPTNLRSTGSGVASTFSIIIGTSGPGIVAAGKSHQAVPYFIVMILASIGTVAAAFLPETLNQKLPETIDDANSFGKDHKFWSYRIKSNVHGNDENESDKLNNVTEHKS